MTNILTRSAPYSVAYLQAGLILPASIELGRRLYQVGFVSGLRKLHSMGGFEKISKAMMATIELISHCPQVGDAFRPMFKSFTSQKDIIYATAIFDNVGKFVYRDKETKRLTIRYPSFVEALQFIGSVCETFTFAKKQGLLKLEWCTRVSNRLGAFEVAGIKPFTYRPFNSLAERPKDFFILASSIIDVVASIHRYALPSDKEVQKGHGGLIITPPEAVMRKNRQKEVSIDNLLKQVGNIGKIYLILMGSRFNTPAFAVVNFITQSSSLLAYVIKNK